MNTVMDVTGLGKVFDVLRAHAMSLTEAERYAYLASLAVEQAAMHEALARLEHVDVALWDPPRVPQPRGEAPPHGKVWDLAPRAPRLAPRHAVAAVPGPRRGQAPSGSSL